MKLTNYFIAFIKSVVGSRLAQILFFIQLILLIIALIQKGTIQPEHFEYDNALYKVLLIINLPAWIITAVLMSPLLFFVRVTLENNLISLYPSLMILVYIGWQIQAALIGYGIEKLLFGQMFKRFIKRLKEGFL